MFKSVMKPSEDWNSKKMYYPVKKVLCLVIGFFIYISPATTFGFIDDVGTRLTLKGIEGFQVVLGGDPAGDGGNASQDAYLQGVIENKLRTAGIKVLSTSECIKAPGSPWLVITLNLDSGEPTHFKINLYVCQKAYLARNRANAYVVTWSTGYTGWVTRIGDIDPLISAAVDGFIEAWQSVNLKDLVQ